MTQGLELDISLVRNVSFSCHSNITVSQNSTSQSLTKKKKGIFRTSEDHIGKMEFYNILSVDPTK